VWGSGVYRINKMIGFTGLFWIDGVFLFALGDCKGAVRRARRLKIYLRRTIINLLFRSTPLCPLPHS
jgi:hypothetical protein